MKKINSKVFTICWLVIVAVCLVCMGCIVYYVDPYFHFHKPHVDKYYYDLDNERSQNYGIARNFDYDAIITGTSMTQNFKKTECDEVFGVDSVKTSFSGGSFKEINDYLKFALGKRDVKLVIRGIDLDNINRDRDSMRYDEAMYPTYLYDDNLFNDVKYLYNKDVIPGRIYSMLKKTEASDFSPGITSFDDYSWWMGGYSFGIKALEPDGIAVENVGEFVHLTDEDKVRIEGNIVQNVTSLAAEYPQVDFYYFITPYSILYWNDQRTSGEICRTIEAEQYAMNLMLECDNIHLFSFNTVEDITCNLNLYSDHHHYGSWVNSLMLKWMKDGKCQITKENVEQHINDELELYLNFDYKSLEQQEDYEDDSMAEEYIEKIDI